MDRHPIKPLRGKKRDLQYGLDFAEMNELIVSLDSQELYIADGHDGGVKICDIIPLNSDTERTAIVSPISGKFYYVINDNALWFYNNEWIDLGNTPEEEERQLNEENRQNAEYVRIENESTRKTQEEDRKISINNLRYIPGGYVNTIQYYKNNIIGYQGNGYITLQDTIGHAPTLNASNDYWGLLGTKGTDGITMNWINDAWSSTRTYYINDSLFYNGSSYRCIATVTGYTPTNITYWKPLAVKGDFYISNTAPTTPYVNQIWLDTSV
jgi:hypothetical protein